MLPLRAPAETLDPVGMQVALQPDGTDAIVESFSNGNVHHHAVLPYTAR
jgi:hypothetical protein